MLRELLNELDGLIDQRRQCVWCAVVETRGSTPQKPGAAMIVLPDGSQRGTLGGGCVEAEVKQRALRVLSEKAGRPEILTVHLDDNYGWDDGLICGGRMTILADPLVGPNGEVLADGRASYYRTFRALVEEGRGCVEAVVLADGRRFLFDSRGALAARMGEGPAPELVARHLPPLEQRPRPAVHQGIAYLPILPRITLLIVGGGHVGQAVARLAAEVDFDIWVLDDRETYASAERFPMARRRFVGPIGPTLRDLAAQHIDSSVYCVIVTRGHHHDEEALYHLAETSAGYVGMIGSKRKIKLIFDDLIAKGISVEALRRVHAPLGFAIGSQTVPEIAISIVAELIARRNLGTSIPAAREHVTVG
ncbi:MAG: XdhC family protein [Gemmataceae bacterium]|nr:XdhC family protein [Gemmataceae bacterium]MDW8263816.1 XdhC family protein [Gemmataceae bacterium]